MENAETLTPLAPVLKQHSAFGQNLVYLVIFILFTHLKRTSHGKTIQMMKPTHFCTDIILALFQRHFKKFIFKHVVSIGNLHLNYN